jgi:replicative DNA helicase
MKQFKFDDEQIVIDKYLPHNWPAEKMILSCLLINSDAIEVTIRNIPIDAFIFKTIKKFIGYYFHV